MHVPVQRYTFLELRLGACGTRTALVALSSSSLAPSKTQAGMSIYWVRWGHGNRARDPVRHDKLHHGIHLEPQTKVESCTQVTPIQATPSKSGDPRPRHVTTSTPRTRRAGMRSDAPSTLRRLKSPDDSREL